MVIQNPLSGIPTIVTGKRSKIQQEAQALTSTGRGGEDNDEFRQKIEKETLYKILNQDLDEEYEDDDNPLKGIESGVIGKN